MNNTEKTKERSFFSKYLLQILLVIFFIPFIGVLIEDLTGKHLFSLYTFGITDVKDFYTFWIAVFGVIGVAYNISQNQKRIYHQEKQLVNQDKQLEKQQQQIELQKKVERDNRFAKGVELLGNSSESARAGAAYNLYFLAKEFPEEYKDAVFNILCSHIRTMTNKYTYKMKFENKPSNEIQTLMKLLFNNNTLFSNLEPDLFATKLMGAMLNDIDLSKVIFSKAYLSKADLSRVNLSKAKLSKTKLNGAKLSKVNLSMALMYKADLTGARLIDANLYGAYLLKAHLTNADMSYANLQQANLENADLKNAILWGASLQYANLRGADLRCADLLLADLRNANLEGADLRGAAIEHAIR